jgi:hypothetical protein
MKIKLIQPVVVLFSVLFALSQGCSRDSEKKSKYKKTVEIESEDSKDHASKPARSLSGIESEDSKDHASKPARSLSGKQKATSAKASGKTQLIVLGDKRCTEPECQIAPMIAKLQTITPGIEVITHDWSEAECKSLFDSESLKALPAFLFET